MIIRELIKNNQSKNPDFKLGILGVSYKADSDDLRESPSLEILEALISSYKDNIFVVDPNINELPPSFKDISLISIDEALSKCHVLIELVGQAF